MSLTPPSPSNDMLDSEVLTADEFNLWCALSNMPFRLTEHVWPDGATEWDVEVHPGRAAQTVAYGTGQNDEAVAAAMAFAFVAGVEWSDNTHRAADEASGVIDPEGDGDDRAMPPRQVGPVFTAPVAALAGMTGEDRAEEEDASEESLAEEGWTEEGLTEENGAEEDGDEPCPDDDTETAWQAESWGGVDAGTDDDGVT